MASCILLWGGMSLKDIKTKSEGGKPEVLGSAAKVPKTAMKDLWLKSKEKTIAEVKNTSFPDQQAESANTPANHAEDQMLSGIKTTAKKGANLTYRGGKKLAQRTARKIQEKREVSRSLSEIKSTGRNVISESKKIDGKNTQSIQKAASTIRSKDPASKVIKGKPQRAVKTVNRSVKGVKQGGKGIKTAQRSAKTAQKTAQATTKAAQKATKAVKNAVRKATQADEAKQIATGAAKDVIKKVTEGAANNVMDEYVATPENAGMPNAVKRESRDNLILSY